MGCHGRHGGWEGGDLALEPAKALEEYQGPWVESGAQYRKYGES